MVFLQLMVNLSWVSTWRKGDVTAAFLQGAARNVEVFGVLYLEPPNRPLAGVMSIASREKRLRASGCSSGMVG